MGSKPSPLLLPLQRPTNAAKKKYVGGGQKQIHRVFPSRASSVMDCCCESTPLIPPAQINTPAFPIPNNAPREKEKNYVRTHRYKTREYFGGVGECLFSMTAVRSPKAKPRLSLTRSHTSHTTSAGSGVQTQTCISDRRLRGENSDLVVSRYNAPKARRSFF